MFKIQKFAPKILFSTLKMKQITLGEMIICNIKLNVDYQH